MVRFQKSCTSQTTLMPKNMAEKKHLSLQIDFYTAQTLCFLIKHYGCIQKSQMRKNRGQAISSCDFDQIRPTLVKNTYCMWSFTMARSNYYGSDIMHKRVSIEVKVVRLLDTQNKITQG